MDLKRGVLEILLRQIRFESISVHTASGDNDYRGAKREVFLPAARVHLPDSTEDENIQLYLWAREQLNGETAGIFSMILEIARGFLEIKESGFCYRNVNWTVNSQFFHWKELVTGLGQEIFTMALLADWHVNRRSRCGDSQNGHGGTDWNGQLKETLSLFLCQPFPLVTDRELSRLLGREDGLGPAENHFHLKGSFPVFLLNWTCLMNHVGDGNDFFHRMKEFRETEQLTGIPEKNRRNLFQAATAAAGYRLHLFEVYSKIPQEARWPFSFSSDPDETELGTLQRQIRYYRGNLEPRWDGEKLFYGPDYALDDQWELCGGRDEVSVAGERYFLYRCFCEIFKKDSCFRIEERNLFYKYLLIALRIRAEFVQSNRMRGFGNFAVYQDRKEDVIDYYPEYAPHVIRLTGCSLRKWHCLSSMEMRLSPKPTAGETLSRIEYYQQEIGTRAPTVGEDGKRHGAYFYVVHFPKEQEAPGEWERGWADLRPRNDRLRKVMDLQMEEQKQLIRIEQRNYQDLGKLPKVRGYDTCSGEIGCRPEVFARCYRGIQSFAKEVNADWIHWTYHVGEDFLDLVDGLRAIDEAVLFCQLPRGSRLGHGMALGLDAVSYYQLKQRKILLPGQDLMDNIAWTLGFCREHGIVIRLTLRKKLEEKFSDLHRKIYGEVPLQDAGERADGEAARQIEAPDSETLARREAAAARVGGNLYDYSYYDAWKLRGDWPEYYLDDEENLSVLPPEAGLRMEETEGDQGEAASDVAFVFSGKSYGQKKSLKEIRADRRCREYYRRYHFSRQVREKGERPEFFEMDFAYMELIGRMQEELRHLLTEKKIGIECNPTSNYKIGPFNRFDRHPMLRMYDRNLGEGAASRMSVSINTDDMGVFQTSLETEYAAMYVALRKCRDEQGRFRYSKAAVLRWLEDVKESGQRQAFLMKEEI